MRKTHMNHVIILYQSYPTWIRCKHCKKYLIKIIDLTNTLLQQYLFPIYLNLNKNIFIQTNIQSIGFFATIRIKKQTRFNNIKSIKIIKKSFSIIINLVLLNIYIVNISFDGLSVLKYTKIFIFYWYYNYQI